jgi:plasmid stability protein
MKQLTIRNVPDEVAERLDILGREQGTSVNAVVIGILTVAVGVNARRDRLHRYATWTKEDAREFQKALAAQRVVDEKLWR